MDPLFCQLSKKANITEVMTIFSFFNRAEREALSGGHFWYHLSGARHGQCQQTSAINDTNLHNTQTIFTPLSVFPLKYWKLIISFWFSVSLSLSLLGRRLFFLYSISTAFTIVHLSIRVFMHFFRKHFLSPSTSIFINIFLYLVCYSFVIFGAADSFLSSYEGDA
jgi:hypothetical protein